MAYSEAFGINYYREVGTNFGKLNPILAASL
jgi:hypothetical protein